MTLEDLQGLHELSGVEFGIYPKDPADKWSSDANSMTFVLDGKTYTVIESEDDGYRRAMRDIVLSDVAVTNTFAPVQVLGRMGSEGHYSTCDIIQFIDVVTGKIVLEAGTENSDDDYPSYVANFSPENMASNQPPAADAVDPHAVSNTGNPPTRD